MVRIRNLTKKYGSFPVLRGLSMDVYDGDVYGFLGRNGCGKTTTMNIICDIIPKDEGEIELGNGQPIKIGYLPESPKIYGYMTAREYLEYIAACGNYDGDVRKRVNEVLDIVGLTAAADKRSKGYSRGMTQRLGMGAAILGNPDLLIFDEPTSALDPQGRAEVIAIINRLKGMGSTIVLSTHILSDVERVANRVGIMNAGTLAEEGELKALLRKYGGDVISLSVRGLTQESKIKLLSVDFARAEFNNDTGIFRFGTDNADDCAKRLMRLMADNEIIAENFHIGTATLEEVFGKVGA
jgi:ABC-2 type transport system ATP-binding protein